MSQKWSFLAHFGPEAINVGGVIVAFSSLLKKIENFWPLGSARMNTCQNWAPF